MKIYNINGDLISVDVRQSSYPLKLISNSQIQQKAKEILLQKYRNDVIIENFIIPESKLSVDFFLPKRKLVIEIDGEQHNSFNSFFHKSIHNKGLTSQLNRDDMKENWAKMNGFRFLRFDKTNLNELINV